jgi:hypothetical protein
LRCKQQRCPQLGRPWNRVMSTYYHAYFGECHAAFVLWGTEY